MVFSIAASSCLLVPHAFNTEYIGKETQSPLFLMNMECFSWREAVLAVPWIL